MYNLLNQDCQTRHDCQIALAPLLVTVGELTDRAGDAFVFGRFGLSTARYALLTVLEGLEERPSLTQLRDLVMRSAANLTQSIDALERDGLVRRTPSPTDRRVYLIEMTEKGTHVLGNVNDYFRRTMTDYLSDFSDEELRQFVDLLKKFGNKTVHSLTTPSSQELPPNVHAKLNK